MLEKTEVPFFEAELLVVPSYKQADGFMYRFEAPHRHLGRNSPVQVVAEIS